MKPLVVLDIETTGTDKTGGDWIVQFAAIKVNRETNKMIDKLNLFIRPEAENYTMSISAFIKHRIHPDQLKDKPTFRQVANQIYDFIKGCDILTYNGVNFDLPFLMNEFAKVGIKFLPTDYVCYDSYKEEARRNGNKLSEAFKRYCGRSMEDAGLTAHDGFSDVKACYAVFRHQNETSEVQPENVLTDDNTLVMGEFNGNQEIMMNIGRYRDVPLKILKVTDPSYLTWMLSTNISEKTRDIINKIANED